MTAEEGKAEQEAADQAGHPLCEQPQFLLRSEDNCSNCHRSIQIKTCGPHPLTAPRTEFHSGRIWEAEFLLVLGFVSIMPITGSASFQTGGLRHIA